MNILEKKENREAFTQALNIVKRLDSNGFKAYFAGGAVRDMLLGKASRDFDIVTNAPGETIPGLFNGYSVKTVGKSFSVCLVDGIEVASCRAEKEAEESFPNVGDKQNRARGVQSGRSIPLGNSDFPACDLASRDLTINSMAFDPLSNTVIDPFAGQSDLEDRIIRFTGNPGERIKEDPLRMVRACRFVSALQGALAPSALAAIRENGRHLMQEQPEPQSNPLAFERIQPEILKAMTHDKPSLFFTALHSTGLLAMIFPSLNRCFDLDGGPHHGETVFEHCMLTGDALSPRWPLLRLAGFLHDTGKYDAATVKDGNLTFAAHEKMGRQTMRDLEKLRFSVRDIRYIGAVIKTHMRPLRKDSTPKAVRRLLAFLKSNDITWHEFMRIRIADKSANLAKTPYTPLDIKLRISKIRQECVGHDTTAFSPKDLALDGHDIMGILNIPPGKAVGKIMNQLFEMVLDNPNFNRRNTLKEYVATNFKAIPIDQRDERNKKI